MESSANFAPPPPPPPIKGPIPSKRLETLIPPEAPACVQNAMMTKDKKPFTYTPGGIDLSQIKSPRMAKRVQKNALSEGVTGPPKVSPLAQSNQTQICTPPPPCMAKDMTGMPFQVFPTGPPAPAPMPIKKQQQPLSENGTQNGTRKKSPQPPQEHYEPPPMGFRPEIKIPQNPIANLKPTPRPQQNDDFWIEEYKSDKAAEPVLGSAPVTAPTHKSTTTQSSQNLELEPGTKQESQKHKSFHDKKGQLGQLYIPLTGEMDKQQLMHQQSPPWMSSNKQQSNATPEWVNSPQVSIQGERRIPIQIERTPTKTPGITPMTPNLCPQPFYGANKNPINAASVVSAFEPSFQVTPNNINSPQQVYTPPVQYNPNQFVSQGYQNVDFRQQQQKQNVNGGVTRIIPIKLEGAVTPPVYGGPISQSPILVQSDPRQQQSMQWSNNIGGTPTQSRSFKVLQKITDAYAATDPCDMSDTVPMQYQQAHYSKPITPLGDDSVDNTMIRMKLNDEDQAFMNRVRNQVDDERYLHKEENPRYRGSAIPSKAFKLLQNMTNSNESFDEMGPAINRPRQGKPAQSRNEPDEDDGASRPYVPPSEQQVFEPKKYTGANIPSRSFRLLQAMTQPENAAEYAEYLQQLVQSDSTVANNSSSINNINNNFTHFPFPPIPNFMPPPYPQPSSLPLFSVFNNGTEYALPPPMFDPEIMMQMMKSCPVSFPSFQYPNISEKPAGEDAKKPKLTDDMMNDLERLQDVELIDLLDDTTKSILDSLKALQLQYGIHLDGLDVDNDIECSRRAVELLKPDNKATLYSSLTNILKRDCSSGSILSMHSLSERNPEENCDLTEEKVNLIRSLSNLLKAESCISATIQSQSRSRLNSFTTSEKSCRVRLNSETEISQERKDLDEQKRYKKDENTTPHVSPIPVDLFDQNFSSSIVDKMESHNKKTQEEEEEIDFWASIKSDEDELPPRRPLWNQKKPSFDMAEQIVLESEESWIDLDNTSNKEEINKTEYLSKPETESENKSSDCSTKNVKVSDLEVENRDLEQSESTSEVRTYPSQYGTSISISTEDTMSIDIEQEIRDLHEYEAEHLELPLDNIAPPEDFQDQKTPTAESNLLPTQPISNWTAEQYGYMMQAVYHNYYANPANSALLANPVYYHQYLAYQQYMQNFYHQQNQGTPQNFDEPGEYGDQSDNSISEWYDVSQQDQESKNSDSDQQESIDRQNETHEAQICNADLLNTNLSDAKPMELDKNIHEQIEDNQIKNNKGVSREISCSEIPDIHVNTINDAINPQNIDLVVEDHTEQLEEAIVEGKMLIIPSEIVTGDTSLSQDDEVSTSCTVVTATTIEKRPVENSNNLDMDSEIIVYEIDDNQSPSDMFECQYPTLECESMGEEEQEIESLQTSEVVEEEQSEGEEGSEGDECDDIPPLTYFKTNVNEHLPHQLSVIFEVTEYSERASVRSSSVDSGSDSSHEITTPTMANRVQLHDVKEIEEKENVNIRIFLPLRKSEAKEDGTTDANFVIRLSPKGPSLERTCSGSQHNSIIEENDSDISVSVSLPLKRNKFSNISLNVSEEEEIQKQTTNNINDSFDAYESLDIDDEQIVELPKSIEQSKMEALPQNIEQLVQIKHQQMHPMQFTIDSDNDTDSNMGDNEYETSAQSSSTMINVHSLSALSNLNSFMGLHTFNRASSVPPTSTHSDNKTDEAIQRRFQTLREQWGQLTKTNNETYGDENKGSAWKITFFDANQHLFNNVEEQEVVSSRPQSCLTIQQNEPNDYQNRCRTERAKSEFNDNVNKETILQNKSFERQKDQYIEEWERTKRVSRNETTELKTYSNLDTEDSSVSGVNDSWWPKRRISPHKKSILQQKPSADTVSSTTIENWCPKTRISQNELKESKKPTNYSQISCNNIESDDSTNWWPKRKVNSRASESAPIKKISPPRKSEAENGPLKYKMVQIQALESESDSIDDSESEEEIEPGTSHTSLSESSYNSWKKSSSKTLKSFTVHSNSSASTNNNYHSASETATSDCERAHSCPRQGVMNDRPTNVICEMPLVTTRPPRPSSCTREMEPKSDNIRFIRASSVSRETSLSRQSSQSFGFDVHSPYMVKQEPPKFTFNQWATIENNNISKKTWEEYIPPETDKSPMSNWINAHTLSFPERLQTPPRQYRSLSVSRETPPPRVTQSYRPASCTREMETVRPEKKTSSLYRQLSINNDIDMYRNIRQSPCSFTTHPERPASCTLELDFCANTLSTPLENNTNPQDIKVGHDRKESFDMSQKESTPDEAKSDFPVVLRRRVKRQPRPVSCAGELEKQSYRNSLEGSRLAALTEHCPAMPTVIEIHHNQPARPSSCTKELESTWANKAKSKLQQRPRTRAHSVTREITLCTSPALSATNAPSEGTVEKRRVSVRDRVNAIEEFNLYNANINQTDGAHGRDASVKSSIDESEADDDSGVQSSKYVSEVETDNEGFSELRKMTPYQRANTQTKLYQYLQECVSEEQEEAEAIPYEAASPAESRTKKIVHNVSAIRRQNPEKIKEAETTQQRRQRLSLPLVHQHSSGIESVDSSVASPSSPVRDKLVNELVQSLLLKKDGRQFRNIPLEKLHAAALKILEEEEQSHAPSTVYSTPAQTPSEFQLDSPCSYEDYHASWQQTGGEKPSEDNYDYSVFPSKTFKRLHDQVCGGGASVSGSNLRRGSLPRSPLLRSSPYGTQDGTTGSPYPHSHSPSPFGN